MKVSVLQPVVRITRDVSSLATVLSPFLVASGRSNSFILSIDTLRAETSGGLLVLLGCPVG